MGEPVPPVGDNRGIAPYLRIPTVSAPVWLTDGTLAYLDDASGVPQIWRTTRSGAPVQLTDFAERIGALAATPDGRQLVFGMDSGGNERQQLWTLAPDADAPRSLTNAPEVIHAFGTMSPDGQRFAYAANQRDPRWFDLWDLNLLGPPAPRMIHQADEHLTPLAYSPDGQHLLVYRANTNLDGDLLLLPAAGGKPRVLLPHHGEATFHGAAFSPDGRAIYLVTNEGSDFASLRRLDLVGGDVSMLDAPDWDVEVVALPGRGAWLAYAVNDGGYSHVFLCNMATGDVRPVGDLPLGVVSGLSWSSDGAQLVLAHSGAVDPPAIWTCGLDGAARRATVLVMNGIDPSSFVVPETIHYRSFDGRDIPAFWFRLKDGKGPWPVVGDVHGGPESQRRPQFAPVTQYLLDRGFAVLAPNVRGSTGYGKVYCHLDDVERRMDAVADLAAAVDWLQGRSEVAANRIAVMGQSYGGFMTLAALATYPDRWAAGADVVGIANFVTFLERTGPWRRTLRAAEYGDVRRDRTLLHDISPVHKADRITAPLLIIHGRNDPRVPVGETEQMANALRALGREVELLIFDDEGHGLVRTANRITGYDAAVRFLARALRE